MINIKESAVYGDYKKYGFLPSIDKLLDYRIALMEKLNDKKLPEHFIEQEILATDYLLNKHNN